MNNGNFFDCYARLPALILCGFTLGYAFSNYHKDN